MIQDRLLRPKIVTEMLGVSKSTLSKMGKRGELNPVQITRRAVGYRQSDIEAFINRGKETVDSQAPA